MCFGVLSIFLEVFALKIVDDHSMGHMCTGEPPYAICRAWNPICEMIRMKRIITFLPLIFPSPRPRLWGSEAKTKTGCCRRVEQNWNNWQYCYDKLLVKLVEEEILEFDYTSTLIIDESAPLLCNPQLDWNLCSFEIRSIRSSLLRMAFAYYGVITVDYLWAFDVDLVGFGFVC